MWVYNLCISSGRTGMTYFFSYDEATAKKGQNEVISFLNHYLYEIMDNLVVTLVTVYIFTDNYSSQNKNYALVQYLYTLVTENLFGLKTI